MQNVAPNLQDRKIPQTWVLALPLARQKGHHQLLARYIAESVKRHTMLKILSYKREQKTWSRYIHRRSENDAGSPGGPEVGTALQSPFAKTGDSNCYFKSEDNIWLQGKHEKSRKYNAGKDKHNNLSLTNPKDTDTCNLPYKQFKITVLRKLNEPQKTQEDNATKSHKIIQTKWV